MEIPEFLIADNSEYPEKIYVFHTEYPMFLLDVETEEVEWFDELEEEEGVDLEAEIAGLIDRAFDFFDREMEDIE